MGGLKEVEMFTKRFLFLFAVVLASAAKPAMAIGERACADAGIRGRIVRQSYELVTVDDPTIIMMDVLLHVTVRVKTVLFGPRST